MNRDQWLAFLRSNDEEAKELLQQHPGLEPVGDGLDMKARWKDPGFRARNAAAVRETLKARWKDPGFRARNAAAVRENWKDPEFRARHAAAVRENWKDPEFRARHAAAVRENWKDPEFRARNAAAVSAAQRRRWRTYRRKPSP
jgi:hypothetical protein